MLYNNQKLCKIDTAKFIGFSTAKYARKAKYYYKHDDKENLIKMLHNIGKKANKTIGKELDSKELINKANFIDTQNTRLGKLNGAVNYKPDIYNGSNGNSKITYKVGGSDGYNKETDEIVIDPTYNVTTKLSHEIAHKELNNSEEASKNARKSIIGRINIARGIPESHATPRNQIIEGNTDIYAIKNLGAYDHLGKLNKDNYLKELNNVSRMNYRTEISRLRKSVRTAQDLLDMNIVNDNSITDPVNKEIKSSTKKLKYLNKIKDKDINKIEPIRIRTVRKSKEI